MYEVLKFYVINIFLRSGGHADNITNNTYWHAKWNCQAEFKFQPRL